MKSEELAVDKAWENLANAIVLQAVDDYRRLLRGKRIHNDNNRKVTIEEFFLSEWFEILTQVDGQTILNRLQKEYQDECKTNTANT